MDEERDMDVERHLRELAASVRGHDWSLSADDVRKGAARARVTRLRWGATLAAVAAATVVVVAVAVPDAGRQHSPPQASTTVPGRHHLPAPGPACYAAPAGEQAVAYVVTAGIGGTTAEPFVAKVTAVDLPTGRIRWSVYLPSGIGTPVTIQVADGQGWILGGRTDQSSVLTSVNLATGAVGSVIYVGASSSNVSGLAIAPDGKTAYVTESGDWSANISDVGSTIVPVNLVSRQADTPIQLGATPIGVALAADGSTAYVTTGNAVRLVDLGSRRAAGLIPVDDAESGLVAGPIAVAPSGRLAIVGNQMEDLEDAAPILEVMNTVTNRLESPITLPGNTTSGPFAFTCDSSTAYVSTSAGLARVDLASRSSSLVGQTSGFQFAFGRLGLAVVPGGRDVWMIGSPYCVNACSPQGGPTQLVPIVAGSSTAGKPVLRLIGNPAGIAISFQPAEPPAH